MNLFRAMAAEDLENATRAIPVIDSGPTFRDEPGGLDAVAARVRHASETIGFFCPAGHGVPDVVAGKPLRGRNQGPAGHEAMRATIVRYFKALERVGERMLPVLARALDLPAGHFDRLFGNEAHINLRFLHYPPKTPTTTSSSVRGPTPTTRSSRRSRARRCRGWPCGSPAASGWRRR